MVENTDVLAAMLKVWPFEKLKKMEINDYCLGGSDDTYCRWLEFRTNELGGIGGGSAFKFGVFCKKGKGVEASNRAYASDSTYSWARNYGESADEAFKAIKAGIIAVAEAARRGDLAAVEAVSIAPMVKWKTAFIYQDFERPCVVPIYWDKSAKYLAFGDPAAKRSMAEAQAALCAAKPEGLDIFSYGQREWKRWVEFEGSVAGLIASDGLPWKDELAVRLGPGSRAVTWWSKRPSGKALVVDRLYRIIADKGTFPIYYTRNGVVTHRARVVDIAVAPDYDKRKATWGGALDFEDAFEDYTDGKKSAAVAFLIDEMVKLDGSLKPSDFEYWNNFGPPTQDNLQPFVTVKSGDVEERDEEEETFGASVDLPARNVIYYGPPGTGKTYFLKDKLFPRFTKVFAGKSRARWIVERTDAMSWWKVIAAALLQMGPAKVPQIVEHEFVRAKIETTDQAEPKAMLWSMLQQHTFPDCAEVKYAKRIEPALFRKDAKSIWSVDTAAMEEAIPEVAEFVSRAADYTDEGQSIARNYDFITFHQSMSYEDFIEGIKPVVADEAEGALGYVVKPGIFKDICRRARLDPGSNYALFIDEINRGNVAGVFGELITLIEEDKRTGAQNALASLLPYSRESFSVPPNLFIVGTMNSADRSVEALDTALRRRFSFVEMAPRPDLLGTVAGIDLKLLLETINRRLEALRDRDHRIGHAYLMGIASLDSLRAAFSDRIIPLLQEYFYGDWSRIALVLGTAFVRSEAARVTWPKGLEGDGEEANGQVWVMSEPAAWDAETFKSVYA